jgi:hypothetical protein
LFWGMLGAGLEILRGLRNTEFCVVFAIRGLFAALREHKMGNWKPVDLEALAGDLHHTH